MSYTHDIAMKTLALRRRGRCTPVESPVDTVRKTLPKGDGNWPGYDVVCARLQAAAHKIAQERYLYLSDEHVTLMAIMGCGHEETMKAEVHRLIGRGFILEKGD